jgi:microcystin-dependent protein
MTSGVYIWSQTAGSNATADSTINWAEGQAPSSVNDSARAMMASLAKYRDDMNGSITTGGTSSAYTVTTNSVFDSLAHMSGQTLCFSVHLTNADSPTLNVDGLGAKPIRNATGVSIPAGTLILGSPYRATYFNSTSEWVLESFYGNPYNIPIGGSLDFWGDTAPNSAFAFPYGQAISRTTYATLFSLLGTTYGVGNGSTTFNLPDVRGRVVAGKDNMGGTGAGRMQTGNGGVDGTTLGAAGGADTQTLTLAQLPTGITSTVTGTCSSSNILTADSPTTSFSTGTSGATVWRAFSNGSTQTIITTVAVSGSSTSNNTSGNAHTIVQPTIVANKLIRII